MILQHARPRDASDARPSALLTWRRLCSAHDDALEGGGNLARVSVVGTGP